MSERETEREREIGRLGGVKEFNWDKLGYVGVLNPTLNPHT